MQSVFESKCPKFVLEAFKLRMPKPQDCIFQHLLGPEAQKVVQKSTCNVLSKSYYAAQNTQNSCLLLQNSGCQDLGTAFFNTSMSLKACPEGGDKKNP